MTLLPCHILTRRTSSSDQERRIHCPERAFVPEGNHDNSPAFQRWDRPVLCCTRPEGTAESVECGARAFQAGSRPSLRDLGSFDRETQR